MLLLVLSLFSCRTTKTLTKETSHVATEQHTGVIASTESHTATTLAATASDKSQANDSSFTVKVRELFSIPDSTGRQYVTERTTETNKTYSHKKNNIKTNANSSTDNTDKSNVSGSSDYKSDATATVVKQEEKKAFTPFWVPASIVLACVVFAYAILRRCGAITWVSGVIERLKDKKGN